MKHFGTPRRSSRYFTPDERVIARTRAPREDQNAWRLQARPNVLIEAGIASVTHPERTVLAVLGHQELPSDLAGRHYIRLSHTEGPRTALMTSPAAFTTPDATRT